MNTAQNVNTIATTPKSKPVLPAVRCRTGKIARLPLAIRQQLNERLQDGQEGKELVQWLNGLPEVQAILAAKFKGAPIREQNLSEWRKGGYEEWREEQEMRAAVGAVEEEITGLQETSKEGLTHRLAFYLAARLAVKLKRLQAMPEGEEKEKAEDKLTARLVALRRGDLALERIRLQQAKEGLAQKTKEEREKEFWEWAAKDINRDEFCRRRCFTPEEREAAIDKILGLTPAQRGQPVPRPAAALPAQPIPPNPA